MTLSSKAGVHPAGHAILSFFRGYQVGAGGMLFLNPGACKLSTGQFNAGIASLIEYGLVVRERPKYAYSLTAKGFQRSLRESAPAPRPATKAK